MRNPSSDRITREENKIYYEGELKIEIIPDSTYPTMFWLKWPDGVLSADFYNLPRARQHARKIAMGYSNWDMEE